MKWIGGAVFMAAVLTAVVNAQSPRNCTETDFIEVGTMQNVSVDCGIALGVAANPSSFETDAGVTALNTACTSDCIGRIAQPILCRCGNLTAIAARTQCYRTNPSLSRGITFCREAYADVSNSTVYDIFSQSCFSFPAGGVCPAGCAAAMQGVVDEIGCCFQNVLNSTLASSPDALSIPGAADFFALIQNSELWNACDVTIPSACAEPTGIPALNQELCDGAVTLLATKAVAVFLLLLAYLAM